MKTDDAMARAEDGDQSTLEPIDDWPFVEPEPERGESDSHGKGSGSEEVVAGRAGSTGSADIGLATDASELSGLDRYAMAARHVPLLTPEQELHLAREIREARQQLSRALSKSPMAIALFLRAVSDVKAGTRPATDVILSPFGKSAARPTQPDLGPGSSDATQAVASPWRRLAGELEHTYEQWRLANVGELSGMEAGEQSTDALVRRMGELFTAIEPSYVILNEILERCSEQHPMLDEASSSTGVHKAGAFVAGIGLGAPATDGGIDVANLRRAKAASRRHAGARKRLVESNLRLAFHIARKLMGNGVSLDDLVQDAMLGLMRAAEKYDYRMGYRFSTYASQWIWQAVSRSVADGSRTIRVAAHMHDVIIRLRKVSRQLSQTLGREPTRQQLVAASGLPEGKVVRALSLARRVASLDEPTTGEEELTLHNCVADPNTLDPFEAHADAELSGSMAALLDDLPRRDALVVKLRYGIGTAQPYTLDQIGGVFGVTRERARQIEGRAMRRLREACEERYGPRLPD